MINVCGCWNSREKSDYSWYLGPPSSLSLPSPDHYTLNSSFITGLTSPENSFATLYPHFPAPWNTLVSWLEEQLTRFLSVPRTWVQIWKGSVISGGHLLSDFQWLFPPAQDPAPHHRSGLRRRQLRRRLSPVRSGACRGNYKILRRWLRR